MKVFMLGWEFPPFISGGLGTACFGLTKAMSNMGIEVWLDDQEFVSGYRETQLAYFYNMRTKYLDDLKVYKVGRVTPTKPWPRR